MGNRHSLRTSARWRAGLSHQNIAYFSIVPLKRSAIYRSSGASATVSLPHFLPHLPELQVPT